MDREQLGSLHLNRIYQMDAIEGMKLLPDKSIDMILSDLPYGMTDHEWDTIIPFDPLWEQYQRILKKGAAIVLTASQPFTSKLVMSKLDWFKYSWVWQKSYASNPLMAKKHPLKIHEDICVFAERSAPYFPQGLIDYQGSQKRRKNFKAWSYKGQDDYIQTKTNYPKSILPFTNERGLHPTQKPVGLFEYLIKTYTKERDIVLDSCMGSGTTAVAATISNRRWIGFETSSKYFEVANKRLDCIQMGDDLNGYL